LVAYDSSVDFRYSQGIYTMSWKFQGTALVTGAPSDIGAIYTERLGELQRLTRST
jgi:hypothetical protein